MGILGNIVGALRETNENAHGARLRKDVFQTLELIHAAGPSIERESFSLYLRLQQEILDNCRSWSRDGRLKIASQLQAKARENKDFNIGQAYGYFLASAFAESMARESPDAKMVFLHLGTIAIEIEKQLDKQNKNRNEEIEKSGSFGMVDACMVGILSAAFCSSGNEESTEDFTPMMENLPLDDKVLIVCVVFGVIDAIGQCTQQSQSSTLATVAAFLARKLHYSEQSIPVILRDLMLHSEKPETKKYEYIRLGGRTAFSVYNNPDNFESSTKECGLKMREISNTSIFW